MSTNPLLSLIRLLRTFLRKYALFVLRLSPHQSIVQGILEKHGVAYGVDSTRHQGTTFWFELEQSHDNESE